MIEARNERIPPPTDVGSVDIDPAWLPDLAEQYAKERFIPLPGLLTPDGAQGLLESTQTTPARRVRCGLEHVAWSEQTFELGHPAHDFFQRGQAIDLAVALTGLKEQQGLAVWTSAYGLGEYINSHRDSAGSIQLLVCLQSPPDPTNGGELVVNGNRMFLRPGDAIAFEATTLEHQTTPLMATMAEPNPRRMVLVGRYFLA